MKKRLFRSAALLLALLTFLEMFVGLTLLRKPYAFLLALLIAFVDFLPVLGTGTVLIPWGIGELLLGSTGSGLGILALYAISSVLREIAEPHLVGRSLGIHPLLSLLSMYAGFRLFGIHGMVLAPLAAAVIKGAGGGEAAGKGACAACDAGSLLEVIVWANSIKRSIKKRSFPPTAGRSVFS